jgi:hypothetical protein
MRRRKNREGVVYILIRFIQFRTKFGQPGGIIVLLSHGRFFLSLLVRSRVLS